MSKKFNQTIAYLKEIKQSIANLEEEMTIEENLILTIKNALLSDIEQKGSIIFHKEGDSYVVSDIQRRSYAWPFRSKIVNLQVLEQELQKLDILYSFTTIKIKKDTEELELNFKIDLQPHKTKKLELPNNR